MRDLWLASTASADGDQVVWHVEDASRAPIRDRLLEKPEFIPFPSELTRREIAAFSVIVARCGVTNERLRRLTIHDIHHADQSTSRQIPGPMAAELIVEDQPKRMIQFKVFLEALCGVNQQPASVGASLMPGFVHLARGTRKAGPRLPERDRLHQSTPSDHHD
jgi:hypothetical protein